MSCNPSKIRLAILAPSICALAICLASGCSSSTPMYLGDGADLSHYIEQATAIEYPDVETASLNEVTQAAPPMTVVDPDFQSFFDASLEDCVSIALQNAKVLRGYGTPSLQGTRVSPGIDNLANGPAAAGTIYNVAVRESEPGFIGTAGQISSPGSITTNTGLEGNQGVEAALADFDAQLTSSFSFNKSNEARNTNTNNPFEPSIFEQDGLQWQTEIAKKSANGTQIFFRNINNWTENNVPLSNDGGFQALDSWYRTSFEVEVRQPLLRGRGAFIQRMPIVISRIGTDQEIANLEAQLQNMVTNVEIRYWELHCAYRNLDASKTGRDAALETWRIVEDQFKEGADVNKQQVAQAAEQYHFFDAQVIDAYNSLLVAESNLRWLMGIASTDCRVIRPIDEAVMAPLEFDWCASLCEALSYRPELRQERWEIKKRELSLAYAKNSLLPEMNVTALYRWLGNGNRFGTSGDDLPFPDASSGALNELFGGAYQELSFGGEFRMPVGFRRELSNVRNAQLKLARELARIEDMELDITRELGDAIRALKANQRIMQSSFNRWKETTIEEEHFKELADEGLETLDVALDAQRRRAQAEIAFYTAMCEYNKVIALIHRRKGTTLVYSGICMSEGQWPGKAYIDAQENARRRGAATPMNYGWTRPQVISNGQGGASNSNPGYSSASGGTAPFVDSAPIQGGEMIVDPYGDMVMPPDATGIPMDGFPMDQGIPIESSIPTEMSIPIQGSMPSYEPTPAVPGSSSRNQPKLKTRSAQPERAPAEVMQATYEAPISRASMATTKTPPARTTAGSVKAKRIPKRDSASAPGRLRIPSEPGLRRLRATPSQTLPTASVPAQPPTQPQTSSQSNSRNVVRTGGLVWEKFGLTSPTARTGESVAKIKSK